jgi:hypothetical protein
MKKLISFCFILAAVFYSCGGATEFSDEAPHNTPIKNSDIRDTIGFRKVISEMPPDKKIGAMYEDVIQVETKSYYASELLDEKFTSLYDGIVKEELANAWYRTPSAGTLFDTVTAKTRFLVGAVLVEGRLNYYLVRSSNKLITYTDNADALLYIRWELYDTQEKKVVYKHNELGTSRSAESDVQAYGDCVRISFRNFLAEKELADALKKYIMDYPGK